MHRHFVCKKHMELYLIEDYKEIHPGLKGPELTDALVLDLLRESGQLPPEEETSGQNKGGCGRSYERPAGACH